MIALTGGIATGKSTVLDIIKSKGYKVFDCDEYVHTLYQDQLIQKGICQLFDLEDFNYEYLRKMVLKDNDKLHTLSLYLHAFVLEQIKRQSHDTIVDIPLLFEYEYMDLFETIILVYCPRSIQIERLMNRNNISEEQAILLIDKQMDIEEKKQVSTYVIDNSGNLNNLIIEVEKVLEEL